MSTADRQPDAGASALVARLRELGLTIGTAESLTGGLVCGALTSVPGASTVVRGGVVAYASEVKADVLRVDPAVLAREGAVSRAVAAELARGVCAVLRCDVGVSTTGVAGPDPADGRPPGTVFVGAFGPWGILVEQLSLTGSREQIRTATVRGALDLLAAALKNLRDDDGPAGYGGARPERPAGTDQGEGRAVILLRHELGEVLREIRQDQGRTLRDVASSSAVSLGYLSELERGTKEASSELLAAVCAGLGLNLSEVLELVRDRVERVETFTAPVSLPVAPAVDADQVSASAA